MADFTQRVYNIKGLNLYTNPFLKQSGELLRALNVESTEYGAKARRQGYTTLGSASGNQINSLFSWLKDDGTTLYTYRASGSVIEYSLGGTGAWTVAVNGTITNNAHVGFGTLNNTLIVGDGAGSTRHTTNGTAFTNTTLAPVGKYFCDYQGRMYVAGTASTVFYSVANDATNWALSGTADSSSFNIPGAGILNGLFKCADRLNMPKTSGNIYKWDGYAITDAATSSGPMSPYSLSQKEGYFMFLNNDGLMGYGGVRPEIISNAITPYIYNSSGSAIGSTVFNTAPATTYKYDNVISVGDTTENITGNSVSNAVIKYDYLKNEYLMWSFNDKPTAFHTYKDTNGVDHLIFGDATGQVYQYGGATSDNGKAIHAEIMFVIDGGVPELEKIWNWFWAYFNPGCQAKVSFAYADTFQKDNLNWVDVPESTETGAFVVRFPDASRSRLLFVRIYDSSGDPGFRFYGFSVKGSSIER